MMIRGPKTIEAAETPGEKKENLISVYDDHRQIKGGESSRERPTAWPPRSMDFRST
ncbi:hypothetical protein HYR69_05680 [Candidatus Sumerlaeota bacterium]|nr:hypothetical protein [Candidatus Sumerlaeota bacterium]